MQDRISFSDFRQLLDSLENANVEIRVRGLGEPWIDAAKLLLLSDSAMILQAGDDRRIILNIRNVVEFKLEKSFSGFEADRTYHVEY